MQTARQRAFKSPQKDTRGETIKAIHATWRKVVCGVDVNDKDELRGARLRFCEKALGLRRELKSISSLSGAQLGRVLDEMRRLERAPGLPGAGFGVPTLVGRPAEAGTPNPSGAEIHHLATAAQSGAVRKLTDYLGWGAAFTEGFIAQRFGGRTSARMLSPKDANSLTMILLNIAGARAIKARGVEGKVTRPMIAREIPRLKRELGIDQKPPQMGTDYTEGDDAA